MTEPWENEPNEEEWTSAGGSHCLIARSVMGTLCGYVALASGHPWEGRGLFDVPAKVHMGVTWSAPMEPGGPWWIGFDCGHAQVDLIPGLVKLKTRLPGHLADLLFTGREYRDFAFVKRETNELAAQAELAANGHHFVRDVEGKQ